MKLSEKSFNYYKVQKLLAILNKSRIISFDLENFLTVLSCFALKLVNTFLSWYCLEIKTRQNKAINESRILWNPNMVSNNFMGCALYDRWKQLLLWTIVVEFSLLILFCFEFLEYNTILGCVIILQKWQQQKRSRLLSVCRMSFGKLINSK